MRLFLYNKASACLAAKRNALFCLVGPDLPGHLPLQVRPPLSLFPANAPVPQCHSLLYNRSRSSASLLVLHLAIG